MTNRKMIDCTHGGFPSTLSAIQALPDGNIVAMYDTGSPDIAATSGDLAQIPARLELVMIDQGFTGSPNPHATVRDCENGAWTLERAVNKGGWLVPRPTLYLGFPDTVQQAFDTGWRGDVWIVRSSQFPPTAPPPVPPGINVVAEQWSFATFDRSVVYDPTWPRRTTVNVTIPDMLGIPAGEAHNQLTALGLTPKAAAGQRASEIVTSTEPAAGTSVAKGTAVTIVTTVSQTFTVGKFSLDVTGTLRLG